MQLLPSEGSEWIETETEYTQQFEVWGVTVAAAMDVMEAVDGALDNVKNAMDNAIQVNTPAS